MGQQTNASWMQVLTTAAAARVLDAGVTKEEGSPEGNAAGVSAAALRGKTDIGRGI